jgi:hypothetical protein
MANRPEEYEATDPAQAFDDLRAEVSVLRKAVEALLGAGKTTDRRITAAT